MRVAGIGCLIVVVIACTDRGSSVTHGLRSEIPVDTGRVQVAGSELYYEAAGAGAAVVLLHAGFLDRRMWDDQFTTLAESHRVIRYDVRGLGRSGPAASPYSSVEDLRTLLRALDVERASLVGVSLGGRIAVDFAIEYPDVVEKLVLAGPGLSGYQWTLDPDEPWRVEARAAAARGDTVAMAVSWTLSDYMRPAMEQPRIAAKVRAMLEDNVRLWKSLLARGDQEIAPPSALPRLDEIRIPTLLIIGTREVSDIVQIVDSLQAKLPDARTVSFDGVGHFANLERPDEFNRVVKAFLARE